MIANFLRPGSEAATSATRRRRHRWRPAIGLALGLACWPLVAAGEESLPVLARVGPWPVVSQLIGYRGRLWFVNSVKGVNHNSADLHSYDPAGKAARYERHLFSQDAGKPLVADGLLYWPFEDARFSTGVGHFMVTDGSAWRLGTIPSARIFHTHALAASDGHLIAATSAWRAGLQVSDGERWRQAYDHPTPAGRVTRIIALVALEDQVLGQLIGRDQQRLLRFDGRQVTEVPGWPRDRAIVGLTRLHDRVYGAVRAPEGVAVWRTDGVSSERMAPPRSDWAVRALAAGEDGLWAVTADDRGGTLWHSPDGVAWRTTHRLTGGRPFDLAVYRGNVYVGGTGDDGQGVLWGTRQPVTAVPATPSATLPEPPATDPTRDWQSEGERLNLLLADPASYAQDGGGLRQRIYELARAGPPEDFFSGRLLAPMPGDELSLIGGNVRVPAAKLGRWLLLWGMTLAGTGRVPVALIEEPWAAPVNRAEKYFEAPPAAMWAAASLGQNDAPTIAALIGRLGRASDPRWLQGDAIGALTALTGERLGYDAADWRRWWRAAASVPN